MSPIQGGHRLVWLPSPKKGFQVKCFYKALKLGNVRSTQFPWKFIWKARTRPRLAFFIWIAALGKVLTMDSLRKRTITIADRCYMCESNGESVDHLLHCSIARDLWDVTLHIWG